jgi:hypothetical protein
MKNIRILILISLLTQISFGQKPYKFSNQITLEYRKDTIEGKKAFAAWDLSFIGEYKKSLQMYDTIDYADPKLYQLALLMKNIPLPTADSIWFTHFSPHNALQYISARAKNERIVIINEAHHQPMHRAFTESLLQELYDNGFRYLGIETLSYCDAILNQKKYPELSSGYYSGEPQFGNLIRKALEIGFYVFSYETKENVDGKQREIDQANNIKRILLKDSTAKILIHCGFDHAVESPYQAWGYAMAGRLKEFTGIDPLTIDQIDMTERSSIEFDNPYFKLIHLDYDAVFIDSSGNSFRGAKVNKDFDIKVYHPRTKWKYERPNWVFKNNKIPTPILNLVNIDFPCLVLAYKENEDIAKAVPVDVIELKSKSDDKYLALYKGGYIIVVKNEKGEKQEIKIHN